MKLRRRSQSASSVWHFCGRIHSLLLGVELYEHDIEMAAGKARRDLWRNLRIVCSFLSGNVFDQSVVKTIFTFFSTYRTPLDRPRDDEHAVQGDVGACRWEGVPSHGYPEAFHWRSHHLFLWSRDHEIPLCRIDGRPKIISVIANVATEDMKIDFDDFGFSLTSILLVVILTAICIDHMIIFMDILERTWQYVVILCMMYIYTTGYIMGNDESIISWFKQCLAIIFSRTFQITLVSLGITLYVSAGGVNDFLFGIGAIIASAKVEQLLHCFGMGSGGRIGNAMRNAMSMGFYGSSIIRSFRKGG